MGGAGEARQAANSPGESDRLLPSVGGEGGGPGLSSGGGGGSRKQPLQAAQSGQVSSEGRPPQHLLRHSQAAESLLSHGGGEHSIQEQQGVVASASYQLGRTGGADSF